MQRARRLVSVISVAVVGVLALGACGRSAPDVAAYVGDHSYSRSYVDEIVDEIKHLVPPEQVGEVERQVVTWLVLRHVAADHAETQGLSVPDVDPVALAEQRGLPPNSRVAELMAEFSVAVGAIEQLAKPAAPTEVDQREAHSHVTLQGQPVSDEFDSVQQFFNEEQMGRAVGLRNLLNELLEQAEVSINPVYGDLTFRVPVRIGQADSWLAVPLGGGSDAVIDQR
ncbi:MAG TPA: hypothetical protein VFX61_15790 [Micromonosporaceae bacterium]|nr:hypothetical protein [Micromonosporaceae bacterium]